MTWPQLAIACWMLVRIVWRLYALINDKAETASSGTAALVFMLFLALDVALAAVLHAGGFW